MPEGQTEYVWYEATVRVPFPVDKRGTVIDTCEMCRRYYNHTCYLNWGFVPFPRDERGDKCPLKIEGSTDDQREIGADPKRSQGQQDAV